MSIIITIFKFDTEKSTIYNVSAYKILKGFYLWRNQQEF